ncbi:ADP-ribose 1''-phosphate phosphatase [Tothia fuscella]|uniref:ADP-ribose 1''-phosphate phosphatase n=1 Tax=Tothia fuscella TaxID=1048955 RepID=A0A9P4NMN6_9PEZI|nr:ADP-ribose 1''-phosphate phosphatase [Tothia fuscella]
MTETFPPLTPNGLALTEIIGDIFAAPPNTLLIHACNCLGSWSAGIAAAFKKNYPAAFLVYEKHCRDSIPEDLIGTALMIPPWEKDDSKPKHYVGCLFTSKKYGKGRDSPEEILRSTKPAMEQLIKLVGEDGGVDGVRMCRINSGLFSVRWEDSREVLRGIEVEEGVNVASLTPCQNRPCHKGE